MDTNDGCIVHAWPAAQLRQPESKRWWINTSLLQITGSPRLSTHLCKWEGVLKRPRAETTRAEAAKGRKREADHKELVCVGRTVPGRKRDSSFCYFFSLQKLNNGK